jgi:hypothetical protein
MDYASGRTLEATVVPATLVWYLKCFWRHPSNSNHGQFSETEKKSKYDQKKEQISRYMLDIDIAFIFR